MGKLLFLMLLVIIICYFPTPKNKKVFWCLCCVMLNTQTHTTHWSTFFRHFFRFLKSKVKFRYKKEKSSSYYYFVLQIYMRWLFLNKFASFSFSSLLIKRVYYTYISHKVISETRKSIDSHMRFTHLITLRNRHIHTYALIYVLV